MRSQFVLVCAIVASVVLAGFMWKSSSEDRVLQLVAKYNGLVSALQRQLDQQEKERAANVQELREVIAEVKRERTANLADKIVGKADKETKKQYKRNGSGIGDRHHPCEWTYDECVDDGLQSDHNCCDQDGKRGGWEGLRLSQREYPKSSKNRRYVEVGVNTGRDLQLVLSRGPHTVIGFEPIQKLADEAKAYLRANSRFESEIHAVAIDGFTSSFRLCTAGQDSSRTEASSLYDLTNAKTSDGCADIPVYDAAPYMLSNTSIAKGEIDLLVVNCEGCEYGMFESMIKAGLMPKIKQIVLSRHSINKDPEFQAKSRFVERYCTILQSMCTTHRPTFMFPWVWEGWIRREQTGEVGHEV